eukprot:gene11245-biopygen2310
MDVHHFRWKINAWNPARSGTSTAGLAEPTARSGRCRRCAAPYATAEAVIATPSIAPDIGYVPRITSSTGIPYTLCREHK